MDSTNLGVDLFISDIIPILIQILKRVDDKHAKGDDLFRSHDEFFTNGGWHTMLCAIDTSFARSPPKSDERLTRVTGLVALLFERNRRIRSTWRPLTTIPRPTLAP